MMKDREIIGRLAANYAELAALPAQEETRALWRRLNTLQPARPMATVDQVCWNEMNFDGSLTLECESPQAREIEEWLKRKLFAWEHFPVDMVLENWYPVQMAVSGIGHGVAIEEETRAVNDTGDVLSHRYINQFENDEDIEKIRMPRVSHDKAETERRADFARELLGDALPVKIQGVDPYLSVWDQIGALMGMENLLYALADRPEFMLALANRMVEVYMSQLDQLEALGALTFPQPLIHCTGAYTDELPQNNYDPARPRTKDIWMFGLAQPFASVSPRMFNDFEIEPCLPLFARFGLVYYGCCDPLHGKMKEVFRIPNLRKISVSPWADERVCAEQIGGKYVFSRKPNPALLAAPDFNENEVREHLKKTAKICREHGCPLEMILKDVSTVKFQPQRLFSFARIMCEVALEG